MTHYHLFIFDSKISLSRIFLILAKSSSESLLSVLAISISGFLKVGFGKSMMESVCKSELSSSRSSCSRYFAILAFCCSSQAFLSSVGRLCRNRDTFFLISSSFSSCSSNSSVEILAFNLGSILSFKESLILLDNRNRTQKWDESHVL